MKIRPSLANRIIAAFVLMTVAIAGVFSIAIILTFESVENHFVSDSMNRYMDFIIKETQHTSLPRIGPDMNFYAFHREGNELLPEWLRGFSPGIHETDAPDFSFYVLIRDHNEYRYALVLNQIEFEQREKTLFSMVVLFFIICILLAWLLGTLVARTVIAPVIRLSNQVQQRDQVLPLAPPLALGYVNDEVGKLAAAFDATLTLLRQALERERMFTSDVSHEFRTPLMTIASTCELLLVRHPENKPLQIQTRRIANACDEMHELVETLLQLARSTKSPVTGEEISLATLAGEQVQRWQVIAEQKGLTLDMETSAADPALYPAPLLRAVLSNLLRNAIHYTDTGGIRLILESGGFSVLDTGIGIPESDRERIFQSFIRGNLSRGDGIGIGLSLVQRICTQQAWHIHFENRPEGGCAFHVNLTATPHSQD